MPEWEVMLLNRPSRCPPPLRFALLLAVAMFCLPKTGAAFSARALSDADLRALSTEETCFVLGKTVRETNYTQTIEAFVVSGPGFLAPGQQVLLRYPKGALAPERLSVEARKKTTNCAILEFADGVFVERS